MPLEFTPVTKKNPCPVCGGDHWCEIGDHAILCQRTVSDKPNVNPAGGYWHPLNSQAVKLRPLPRRAPTKLIDPAPLLGRWRYGTSDSFMESFAIQLGVHFATLHALGACWAHPHKAWAFPMKDANDCTVGIRLRNLAGQKWAVKGSRSGIFMPDAEWNNYSTLLICEGPTDTAAALTLGFAAIGKPSCNACNDVVVSALRRLRPSRVVIVADVDSMAKEGIGFREAKKLQSMLRVKSVIWAPQAKDIREFLKLGGTRQMIESDIQGMIWQ